MPNYVDLVWTYDHISALIAKAEPTALAFVELKHYNAQLIELFCAARAWPMNSLACHPLNL